MRNLLQAGTMGALLTASGMPALASSDEAWEAFRASVVATCQALVEAPDVADVTIEVDPFGTQTYGAALVTVERSRQDNVDGTGAVEAAPYDRMICIYDKQSKVAELTGSLPSGDAGADDM